MKISKDQLTAIRNDLDEALRVVGEKHGFKLTQGNCRYQTDTFTTKIDGMLVGKSTSGTADTAQLAFDKSVDLYNRRQYGAQNKYPVGLYQTTFVSRGTEFTIVDFKPTAKKYPLIGQNARGTQYKFGLDDIK